MRVADEIARAAREQGMQLETVNLFETDLPELDEQTLATKYAILHGKATTPAQKQAWQAVEEVIDRFTSADAWLLAVPMWNFSIPYRLKHYLDVVIQPTYTFQVGEGGYEGLVTGRPAVVVYSSGGDYSSPEMGSMDMQKPYLELALGFMGIKQIEQVVMAPTVAGEREATEALAEKHIASAGSLAAKLSGNQDPA
jgi:FMN-dependent NADH-azoreductase